jgi:hypothetical protein
MHFSNSDSVLKFTLCTLLCNNGTKDSCNNNTPECGGRGLIGTFSIVYFSLIAFYFYVFFAQAVQ